MAKRVTSQKREKEKIKQSKREDKQRRKEERQNSGSSSFEQMLAYVDANGMLHATPQDVESQEEIDASQIEVSVPKRADEEIVPLRGKVAHFNAARGYGFIRNSENGEEYFFHITNAPAGIAEGDRVIFEIEHRMQKMNAVRISIDKES